MQSGRFKGKVTITNKKGSLGVRFRVQTIDGESRQIDKGLGLNSSRPGDSEKASAIAEWIERDLRAGIVDPTIAKYLGKPQLVSVDGGKANKIDLLGLWTEYTESRRKAGVSLSTNSKYEANRRRIVKIPKYHTFEPESAQAIIDFILDEFTTEVSKELLIQLSACFKWGMKAKKVQLNPFEGAQSQIPKSKKTEDDIDPFTAKERDRIIAAFENDWRPGITYQFYAPYVKFMFFTGCRPSEAMALTWNDVDERYIVIAQLG
jgi:integrase